MKNIIFKGLAITVLILLGNAWALVWDGKIDSEWYWENPKQKEFTITTATQLAGLAQLVNGGNNFSGKTIKLGANIMLNDTTNWQNWNEDKPTNVWTPIGSYTNENNNRAFSGTFDGNNYVVNGIYISNSNSYQGLFGYTFKATIKNLGITASYIKGGSIVGGLAGFSNNSTITNCYSIGNTNGSSVIGGLVGNNKGKIAYCYAIRNTTGGSIVGGLVGSNEGTIENCYATGNVYTPSMGGIYAASIGGLVGDNGGIITNCYATGEVTGGKSVGGLVGNNRKIITNCYATGDVASYGFGFGGLIGGLVGENSGKIAKCYATGNVDGYGNQGNNVGGLIGSNSGTIDDCYTIGNVSGQYNVGGLVGFDGGSTIGFNTQITTGSTITNCYTVGDVKGSNNVGGLVGRDISSSVIKNSFAIGNVTGEEYNVGGLVGSNGGTIMNSYAGGDVVGGKNIGGLVGITSGKITITNCYTVGKVSGITGSTIGGLIGVNNESTIKSSYYDRQTSTQVDINKGDPKSTTQMKQQATFANWDFSKIWKIDSGKNDGYPYLRTSGNITETMKGSVQIKIDKNSIYVEKEKIANTAIDTLAKILKNKKKSTVQIQAEPDVKYEILYDVVSTLANSGFTDILFTTKANGKYYTEKIYTPTKRTAHNDDLNLMISMAKDYIEIWAKGGVLPKIFYEEYKDSTHSAYDELAKTLKMVRDRFIDAPDANNVSVIPDQDTDVSKVILLLNRAKTAGFTNITLAMVKMVKSNFSAYKLMNDPNFAKDIANVLKNVETLQAGALQISDNIDMASDAVRSKAEITAVFNARMPDLKSIYNKYLLLKPGFSGKVTIKFTIAPSGDIVSISIVSSTTGYGEFDNVIKEQVSRWKWNRIESGNTTATIPFSFAE